LDKGTSLGDLIEIERINEVFQSSHGPENEKGKLNSFIRKVKNQEYIFIDGNLMIKKIKKQTKFTNKIIKSGFITKNPLVVGAAKSCVGHAETVSGLIGVVITGKTRASFAAGAVPGPIVRLTANNMNPSIDCSVVPLHIPSETAELKKSEKGPLRAMIL
jgi:acyl transferase domain-containing protein